MREIKFRAQNMFGRWVYGFLLITDAGTYIVESKATERENEYDEFRLFAGDVAPVIPETVGEYTGLRDKHGKEIFEGDVVADEDGYRWKVCWGDAGFWQIVGGTHGEMLMMLVQSSIHYCEVIGNIHDNPELLEAK